jgi:hypothetical protein
MFWVITHVSMVAPSLASALWATFGVADHAGCLSLACQERRRTAASATYV